MEELQFIDPYIPLPRPEPGTTHLDHQYYERAFEERIGVEFDALPTISLQGIEAVTPMVPIFDLYSKFSANSLETCIARTQSRPVTPHESILDKLLIPNRYLRSNLNRATALQFNTAEELAKHMLFAYQISAAHYVLGKYYNISGSFPDYCCVRSSASVALSLIHHGYTSTVIGKHKTADHTYILMPFVLTQDHTEKKGSILIDPTAEQTYSHRRPRVLIEAKFNPWTHITNWKRGANLYPTQIDVFDLSPQNLADASYDEYFATDILLQGVSPALYFKHAYKNLVPPPKILKE